MVLQAAIDAWNRGERVDTGSPVPVDPPSPVIHVALVVPDMRLWQLLKDKAVVYSHYSGHKVALHVLVDDKRDPLSAVEMWARTALVESGLVHPEDAHFTYPDQVTLGWPTENQT